MRAHVVHLNSALTSVLRERDTPEHEELPGPADAQDLVPSPVLPADGLQHESVVLLDVERAPRLVPDLELRAWRRLVVEESEDLSDLRVVGRTQGVVGRDPTFAVDLDDADAVEVLTVLAGEVRDVVEPRVHLHTHGLQRERGIEVSRGHKGNGTCAERPNVTMDLSANQRRGL